MFDRIAGGAVVLTVNSRLALHLQSEYEQWRRRRGDEFWPTAAISSWSGWLQEQWQILEFDYPEESAQLLSEYQAGVVWESVIAAFEESSESGEVLLNRQSAARSAMGAWQILRRWSLSYRLLAGESHPDVRAFYHWAQAFDKRCRQRGWLDSASLTDELIKALDQGRLPLSGEFICYGFDELTPQHQALLAALERHGAVVDVINTQAQQSRAVLQPCADQAAEIRAVANWLRGLLESGDCGRVAVVVPELASLRPQLEQIFNEVLLPERMFDLADRRARPYNISLARPLAQTPVIHAALSCLELCRATGRGALPLNKWGRLLLSPFLAGAQSELVLRAQLDAVLRDHGEDRLTLRQMLYWLNERSPCPQLAERLNRFAELLEELPRRQTPGRWAGLFQELLKATGWPGDRTLDSETYQAIQAWHKALMQFAALDQVTAPLSVGDALTHLRQVATATLFQPQSRGQNIQVLGILEASGLKFDHCWVMGLHDGVWPPAPQPNPFLPITLQREQRMPHASAERELAYAERITERLLAAAPTVVVSYPMREGDADLRVSPLVDGRAALADSEPVALSRVRDLMFESRRLEAYSDWRAPELPRGSKVAGGTGVFKDQAACPFRAFARHRLAAVSLAEEVSGLDAAGRGNLVHHVLELFWRRCKDLQTLNSLDDDGLGSLLQTVVGEAVAAAAAEYPQLFSERFTELEKARLQKLIFDWLQQERLRPSFSVLGTEVARRSMFADLELKVKADRIDRLADGRQMIIDYKTGSISTNNWFGERPDEPQLPFYAVSDDAETAALAFVSLKAGEVEMKGVGSDDKIAAGIKPGEVEWSVQQGIWRDVLTRLADQFRSGYAPVDPKDAHKASGNACAYCDLGPLCRINELDGHE